MFVQQTIPDLGVNQFVDLAAAFDISRLDGNRKQSHSNFMQRWEILLVSSIPKINRIQAHHPLLISDEYIDVAFHNIEGRLVFISSTIMLKKEKQETR